MRHISYLVVLLSFFLVSCFENETKLSAKKDVHEILEARQEVAASFARSLQLHAAATIDGLMAQAVAGGEHLSVLEGSGSVTGLSAGGLVDNASFSAVSSIRNSDSIRSGYCDGYVYTWMAGELQSIGGAAPVMVLPAVKGLGENGLGSVAAVLSKQVGGSSYGTFETDRVVTPNGEQVTISCSDVNDAIPDASPVLFQQIDSQFELSRTGSLYEFTNVVCPGSEEGFQRFKRLVTVEYNASGNEVGRVEGPLELFINSCHDASDAERLTVAATAGQVDLVDFASASLSDSASTTCFEASTTKVNEQGGVEEVRDGAQFSNCQSSTDFESNLSPEIEITCGSTPVTFETDVRSCTGSGWTGSVTYTRDIYSCTMTGGPNGSQNYQRKEAWVRSAVNCSRPESSTPVCPFGPGGVDYSRTNTITDPVTLSPNNPVWNYNNDSCSTNEVSCFGSYAGNGRFFTSTVTGANANAVPDTVATASVCTTGQTCTVERTVSCPSGFVGNQEERRTYTCGAGWTSYSVHDDSACLPIICTPNSIDIDTSSCTTGFVGTRTRTRTCNALGTAYGPYSSFDDSSCVAQICTAGTSNGETRSCGSGFNGNETRTRTCNGLGTGYNFTSWSRSSCVAQLCSPGSTDNQTRSCGTGFIGNETRTLTCNSTGTGYNNPSWSRSACVAQVCTPGSVDTQSRSCGAGFNGNETRSRTCNSSGTGYGAFSAYDRSSCAAQLCTPGSVDTQSRSCGSGFTGNETRSRTCNSSGSGYGSFSSYDRSSCVAVPPAGSCTVGATVYNNGDVITNNQSFCPNGEVTLNVTLCCNGSQRTVAEEICGGFQGVASCSSPSSGGNVCTPGSIDTQSRSCGSGFTGNETRSRTCNSSGSGYGSFSSYDRSSCVAQVCTPGSIDSQSRSCGSGFTGNETRSRTCNSSGSGYGSFSSYDRSSCVVVPPAGSCTVGATVYNNGDVITNNQSFCPNGEVTASTTLCCSGSQRTIVEEICGAFQRFASCP